MNVLVGLVGVMVLVGVVGNVAHMARIQPDPKENASSSDER